MSCHSHGLCRFALLFSFSTRSYLLQILSALMTAVGDTCSAIQMRVPCLAIYVGYAARLPSAHSTQELSCCTLSLQQQQLSVTSFPAIQMGGPEMLTHHIAAFLSVALASYTGQAHLYTLLLLSTELTTPFVNGRWFIDQMV